MVVIVVTLSPAKLLGHLTRWLFEISPGVYVGKVSARVRELLWDQVLENIGSGRAIMVFSSDNEQGLEFRTHGQEWQPVDFDGLELIMRPNNRNSAGTNQPKSNPADSERLASFDDDADDVQPSRPVRPVRSGWSLAAKRRKYGHR